jgi:TRAP-type C4-dicarboxylate transport system substrate-binding protein
MLSQLRAGGIDLLAVPSMTLSTLVPLSGLPSVGFAFQSYDQVWAAMDGAVGDIVRNAIAKAGIVPVRNKWTTASGRSPRPRGGSSTASTICVASRSASP